MQPIRTAAQWNQRSSLLYVSCGGNRRVQHKFLFDDAFDETTDNEQVYERTVKPLVLRLFQRSVIITAIVVVIIIIIIIIETFNMFYSEQVYERTVKPPFLCSRNGQLVQSEFILIRSMRPALRITLRSAVCQSLPHVWIPKSTAA